MLPVPTRQPPTVGIVEIDVLLCANFKASEVCCTTTLGEAKGVKEVMLKSQFLVVVPSYEDSYMRPSASEKGTLSQNQLKVHFT